jgi:hypothetical protein
MGEVFRDKVPAFEAEKPEKTAKPSETDSEITTPVLAKVDTPDDLKKLSREELHKLCDEIREHIIDVVVGCRPPGLRP